LIPFANVDDAVFEVTLSAEACTPPAKVEVAFDSPRIVVVEALGEAPCAELSSLLACSSR
jgi:hypothetical protein